MDEENGQYLTCGSVRVDNSSLLNDLLSDTAYRTMSSVKSYIDSEVLASESYCYIHNHYRDKV
jgi:hypothetical protein